MTTSKFHARSIALEVVNGLGAKLDGKVVLITGATSGNVMKSNNIYLTVFLEILRYWH